MKAESIIALLVIISTQTITSQQDAPADMFPLAVGNQWTYHYYSSSGFHCYCDFGSSSTTDSGMARIMIVDVEKTSDSTRWVFIGRRDIMRESASCSYPTCHDTVFGIHDSVSFTLIEYSAGRHQLKFCDDTGDELGVLPCMHMTCDSNGLYRFQPDSSGDWMLRTLCGHTLTFQKNVGEVGNSYSETQPVINGWTYVTIGHSLRSSVVTSVAPQAPHARPEAILLYQNYPNPFNPATTINFRIAQSGRASLKVYDLLGREVATLINEELTRGDHEKTFDAEGLPSGMYLYRLQSQGLAETKKLLLLR